MVPRSYSMGGGGMMPRLYVSPPPRINLYSLLNRNVPTILSNYRRLQQEMNVATINSILEEAETTTGRPEGGNTSYTSPGKSTPLPDCPLVPQGLLSVGRTMSEKNHTHETNYTESGIAGVGGEGEVRPGGRWRPSDCRARHHLAIIVPFRDRAHHLMVLLAHLHPLLQRQQISYRIYVIEQYGNKTFNKARIMNIAFVQALSMDPSYGCFIFHDVDLIPEDDRNMYACPRQPRHMSVAIDEMNYHVPYEELVGGVFAVRTEHFFKVNGYSNLYWGWGAEDDDMAYRLQHVGLKITRPASQIARYKMIRHIKRRAVDSRIRYRLLWTGVRRYKIDGLNSLPSLNYKIMWTKNKPAFTHIMVDIGPPPPGF